jgi:hypothetical protein
MRAYGLAEWSVKFDPFAPLLVPIVVKLRLLRAFPASILNSL